MNPERYQKIDELFLEALERAPRLRAAYLDKACAGDEELRSEVEALLTSNDEGLSFIDTPASEMFAGLLAPDEPELAAGQQISHYRILDLIGTGGMGEVYLAQDLKLGRKVALKLLPADFTKDDLRMYRFRQEARAASLLNHPNILTIHEIGEVDDRHFMATEFIDGENLRQLSKRSRLRPTEAITIAVQVVEALAAAHEAGIVHRDIKPENIMLRPDGYVKVLDFGLAKLAEQPSPSADAQASTSDRVDTQPGLIMGTVNYMSPEQTRGQEIDARSDIFSFGIVIYEMIAGHAPFEGGTTSDLIASILKDEPSPLAHYAPGVMPELQRIVSKALSKDKAERYQTAGDLLVDLRNLRQGLEIQSQVEEAAARTGQGVAPSIVGASPAPPASSVQNIISGIRRGKRGAALALTAFLVTATLIGYAVYRLINHDSASRLLNMRISRITTSGKAHSPAISADGKYVAYGDIENGQSGLWVRHVATASSVPIDSPVGAGGWLTFSPDGDYLYIVGREKGDAEPALYRVPALGGVAAKLIAGVNSAVSFSPDGQRLAFVREYSSGDSAVILANADGSGDRALATRKGPALFYSVAWSPDGKKIACVGMNPASDIVEVDVESGTEKAITAQKWNWVEQAVWLSDGSGLVVVASDKESPLQLWRITYPDGEVQRITTDLNNYFSVSITADSKSLVTKQGNAISNLWSQSGGDVGSVQQITSGSARRDGWSGVDWTPDGRIVYTSSASGRPDLWIMDPDGGNQKQLTVDRGSLAFGLAVSPDGRYIVFNNGSHVCRVDIDGHNPKQLTFGEGESNPFFSPDGQWVFYYHHGHAWKVPIDGGEPVQLTGPYANLVPRGISPDGRLIAYSLLGRQKNKIAVASAEGGEPIKTFDLPSSAWGRHIQWVPDGQAFTYFDNRASISNIWMQSLDGSQPKQLTDFKSEQIFCFAWSLDGKRLVCSRGLQTTDVVLISNLK